jgi:hypothetical protein
MPADTIILLRGGSAVAWEEANPVLSEREPGIETDTRKMKVGDGSTAWNSLPYFGTNGVDGEDGTDGVNADITRTSPTSNAIGTGSKTFAFATSTNLGWVVGSRLRAAASSTQYVEGPVTAVSSTGVTINVDNTAGSGTFTAWEIGVAGDRGATGSAGGTGSTGSAGANADITRTSTTSNGIGTGSLTFAFASSANLGWVVGTRLRAAASSTQYVEGPVTAVSSTSVTINVDNTSGSGTFTSWAIGVAGDRGAAGSGGSSLTPDSSMQTSDFSFGSSSRIAIVSLASASITGTLPATPANGQVCEARAQGLVTTNANRFTLALNGKTINGAGASTGTVTTSFAEAGATTAARLAAVGTSLGASASGSGSHDFTGLNRAGGTGNGMLVRINGTVTFTRAVNASSVITFWVNSFDANASFRVNGSTVSLTLINTQSGGWQQYSYAFGSSGTFTFGWVCNNTDAYFIVDDVSISNVNLSTPSSWTAVNSWQVAGGGLIRVEWSEAAQTWHVINYRAS